MTNKRIEVVATCPAGWRAAVGEVYENGNAAAEKRQEAVEHAKVLLIATHKDECGCGGHVDVVGV